MYEIKIDSRNLEKETNNYDLDLIYDTTWENSIVKRSLVTMIEEIPKSVELLWNSTVIIGIVAAMIVFFQLGVEVLSTVYAIYIVARSLVSIIVAYFIVTGIRHIIKFQKLKRRIYALETKPIRKRENKLYKKVIFFFSMLFTSAVIWCWLSLEMNGAMTAIVLAGICWILFHSVKAKYSLNYVAKNVGYFLHHIQYDMKSRQN